METPRADQILQAFTFKTKEGKLFNDIATDGQKLILEIILNRGITSSGIKFNRVHTMAHTRYGKSLAVGAGVSVRAAVKKEKWAIVAPTKDQAQIIMDYILFFCVNDPVLNSLLGRDAKAIKVEYLTQRRSRNHITFLGGGEIRTFASGATMGFGAENIIEDEAGLIDNDEDSKTFRMLGDSTDNFLMKIGNPWNSIDNQTGEEHHFFQSFQDSNYFIINIDVAQGIKEGRITESYHTEVKKKPNYEILYKNVFPDATKVDRQGYLPLFSHGTIKRALVAPGSVESVGDRRLGADPADGGENESVIATRSMNLARIAFKTTDLNNIQFAEQVAIQGKDIADWFLDKQGVGAGTVRTLEANAAYFRKINPINAGLPVPKTIKDCDQYLNLRAYIFWQFKEWLELGNKIEESEGLEKQLMALKYKNSSGGKIQIISKDELRKRKVDDLGQADAISFTFAPKTKKVIMGEQKVQGGVKPFYPDLGW